MSRKKILILEAFYGGSHKQLTDFIIRIINENHSDATIDLVHMSDKKWQWRMRTSALYFAEKITPDINYTCVFVTSVINLAELMGLRPELRSAHKVLYFHENQLVYPVRKQQERDFQYGYNQILSCMCADSVFFNSQYNMDSFLTNINSYLKLMPDYRPKNLQDKISQKCSVLYYALNMGVHFHQHKATATDEVFMVSSTDSSVAASTVTATPPAPSTTPISVSVAQKTNLPLHIVWAHRWEHDKNPDDFFNILFQLAEEGLLFHVSVLGQSFTDNPDIFAVAKEKLSDHILNWGYCDSKEDYFNVLTRADVAVSTAHHEFFGVSMLEAVAHHCYPLCPNRLVYPEFFPATYLYNTNQQLLKKLRNFCRNPHIARNHTIDVDVSRFEEEKMKNEYLKHLLK